MHGIEAYMNQVYFCDIKFLLLLEDGKDSVLMKWMMRMSKLRARMCIYQYRKIFPVVIRTTQKASFYKVCSQLLHTKNKIKDHDPVKWGIGFSNGILKYRSSTVSSGRPSVIKGRQDVFPKLQCWQLYHELWPFRYICCRTFIKILFTSLVSEKKS